MNFTSHSRSHSDARDRIEKNDVAAAGTQRVEAPLHRPAASSFTITPDCRLDCETAERLAGPGSQLRFDGAAVAAMDRACHALRVVLARGEPIYGITTGFGPFVRYESENGGDERHGSGLIDHLSAGFGRPAPADVVRATMLIRALGLARGYSGIRPEIAQGWLDLFNAEVIPAVPEYGSVGASGDLCPLSHIARVLIGDGRLIPLGHSEPKPAWPLLNQYGLSPLRLTGRDALALVNGTSFMTGYAAPAVAAADRLIRRTETLVGWAHATLGCRDQYLDSALHDARSHGGQRDSARAIRVAARSLRPADINTESASTRPLQEVYSLRCAPQFLGACRDHLGHARRLIETEIDGVSDNPVVVTGERDADHRVLHGGNFQGQQIAFAADAVSGCLTELAVYAERLLAALLDPSINDGAPLLLAWCAGPQSGLAGVQLTATSLVAEMRRQTQQAATLSIPTNGNNQDVVSMGTTAARASYELVAPASAVVSSVAMALVQLNYLRSAGRANGPVAATPTDVPTFAGVETDRPLHDDLGRMAEEMRRAV